VVVIMVGSEEEISMTRKSEHDLEEELEMEGN
jgi:hypothetical protein